jgi:hypothetical protein
VLRSRESIRRKTSTECGYDPETIDGPRAISRLRLSEFTGVRMRRNLSCRCVGRLLFPALAATLLTAGLAHAQDEGEVQPPPQAEGSPQVDKGSAPNETAGEFTPARGWDIAKTKLGTLNFSAYGLVRYLNQLPGEQTFVDHLGRERTVKARNDINWHRTMLWFSGWALDPRLKYVFTVWSLPSTQQTLAFGNLQFEFSPHFILGAGIGPTLTARSMTGSHPLWAASDRQMAEEFFRGGFSSGVWLRGLLVPRLQYWISVNTNLSQLGVTAANDARDMAYSGTLIWLPTTGEYGLRGGLADFEEHPRLATRFGISAAHAREDRASEQGTAPNATQIRLSDGVFVFETGALADGVTVKKANYDEAAFDMGLKYRGFTFQFEYFLRDLSHFLADGPVPEKSIFDHGFFFQAMDMLVPKYLGAYVSASYVFDQFGRDPWEVSGGLSYYPFAARSWRVSLHTIYVHQSPTGSNFGFYTAGQTGPTISLGTDVLF